MSGLLVIATVTAATAAYLTVARKTGLFDTGRAPRFCHGAILRALGFRVHCRGQMAAQRPLLIAANHVSWTDIMVVGALADLHFIAKSEVAGWPLIGRLAKLQRTVFVERQQRRKAATQAGEIAGRLREDGRPMVLFAEGTTGDGTFVLPFKSTLFEAARLAADGEDIWVQPLAIAYTRFHGMPMGRRDRVRTAWIGDTALLPHLIDLLRAGAVDVEVHFGEPISFAAGTDRKRIAAGVEASVRAMVAAAHANPVASASQRG